MTIASNIMVIVGSKNTAVREAGITRRAQLNKPDGHGASSSTGLGNTRAPDQLRLLRKRDCSLCSVSSTSWSSHPNARERVGLRSFADLCVPHVTSGFGSRIRKYLKPSSICSTMVCV